MSESCLLCRARRLIKKYYEDRLFWIADCLHCGKPIIVLRSHAQNISERRKERAMEIIKSVFGDASHFSAGMPLIKGHWHEHIT
jgi:hypothetical protein